MDFNNKPDLLKYMDKLIDSERNKRSSEVIADALIAESLDDLIASAAADDAPPDIEPTDEEIVEVYMQNFGGTRDDAIERLATFSLRVFINA